MNKQIPFVQTTRSGCGSYALANLFSDERFLHNVDALSEKGHGEGVADLNKKLQAFEPDFYLETYFLTSTHCKHPFDRLKDPVFFEILWEKMAEDQRENAARVLFLTVRGALSHYVIVIHDFKTNQYYLVDSHNSHVEAIDIHAFIEHNQILSIEQLCSWKIENAAEREVHIHKDALAHLI